MKSSACNHIGATQVEALDVMLIQTYHYSPGDYLDEYPD